jgi:hypothetical protein
MSNVEKLLAAVEDVTKRSLMYSRIASFLSKLGFVLFVSAALAAVAYILSYGAYWQLIAINIALMAAMFVADKLSDHYYRKALKELDRLETLAVMAALSAGLVDQAEEMLKKKVEELKRGQN